ncbi:MAG: D-alanine--D-alanine ligase [Flavihumibacter sp.]|nr:D-alanine--D-alanine ligase [Flavihumibacter sp.]
MSIKPNIAFVTGGYSGEAEISYKSAVNIEKNLDPTRYNVYKIDITPNGWYYINETTKQPVDRSNFTIQQNGQTIIFDAVFIGIHGTPGEDGKLQGYFDMVGLPYTSCDAATSALTMNKRYTVAVAAFGGINVAKSLHLFKHSPVEATTILQQLTLPLFVKPNNGGSSIGMSKVNTAAELPAALEKAFKEDEQVLVEEFISGREFTVGVFKSKEGIQVLPITEIITHKEFFDYEAKYLGKSEEVTPAAIDAGMKEKIESAAKKVYEVFNCRGVVRIDFIFNQARQEPYMLEINTVPGQTDASVIPQQVRALGWPLKDFYSALLEEALQRK